MQNHYTRNAGVFKRGLDFPNEGFIQKAVEEYFIQLGFRQIEEKYSDFVCVNPETGEKWVIEAKGATKAIGLDFRTCLGQLVQRMESSGTKYAIAVPYIAEYINQCRIVKPWIRQRLQIYWLLVDEDGRINIFSPEDEV